MVDQIKHVYRPILYIILGNTIASIAILIMLWHTVSGYVLFAWFSAMTFASLYRIVVYFRYRKYFQPDLATRYGRYYTIGSAMYGVLWGIAGIVLLSQDNITYQLYLTLLLIGVAGAGVITKTAWLPAIHAFLPTTLIPISTLLLLSDDFFKASIGTGILALIIVIYTYAIHANKDLKESFRLRYENIDLVDQLRQQKDEAEQANISKTKFLAAASHDLRQPLHALTLFTSVLDEEIKYPKVRHVVDQINASVHALQSLFNALLDISRLDAGVMKVDKTDFNLQTLLNKLANDFTPQANEKGLDIYWPDVDVAIHTDATLFEQVLRNYVSNAIRYTHKGEVRIGVEANEGQVTIRVSDTGAGIPATERETIFEEFHQLNNPERDRSKGLGLGLAIVQRTAKLLEHAIDVTSEPGKGSTFSISVPQASRLEAAGPLSQEETTIVPTQQRPALILVIDDEATIRDGTQSLMEAWDCQVVTAADKDEALVKLRQRGQTPDGIIADYRLRESQTGLEAIQAIHREHGEHIPALIVTGDIAVDRLREVNSSGFQVLHKPVAPAKLRAFLRHVQLKRG